LIVVRPDGYVGAIVPLDEAGTSRLETYQNLQRSFRHVLSFSSVSGKSKNCMKDDGCFQLWSSVQECF
jgi:hypothetical protein